MRRRLVPFLILVTACVNGDNTAEDAPPVTTVTTIGASTIAETTPATSPDTTGAAAATTAAPATTPSTLALDETVLSYQVVADLDFPVQLTSRPGEEHGYVITKNGVVWFFDGAAISDQPVLDISDQVHDEGEQGLLSIALHPADTRLYLHYSDTSGDTVVSEFAMSSPGQADPASERILLQVDQPAANHNGGMIQFMPDGSLLLGLGDGGGANDRFGNGQNPDTLLGGLVTMSVEGDPAPTKFAMGLRNPWRFWIDGETIFIADVGQNAIEEVSITPLQPGLNYGWPLFEGLQCFNCSTGDEGGLVAPVLEVQHGDAGTCSITGGIVYRGAGFPQLTGHYFYSDYCGGYLRSFLLSDGVATDHRDWSEQVGVAGQVTGFGVDGAGEMYVTTTGQLLKVVAGG
jgi:glucose/arabinose dehydrogenase